MAVAGGLDRDLVPVAVDQAHAGAGLDPADRADRHAEPRSEARRSPIRCGGCGEQQFVIVAAARRAALQCPDRAPTTARAAADSGRESSSTIAATCRDVSQIWPRSARRPSETSIIACAIPHSAGPRATRGSGSRNRADQRGAVLGARAADRRRATRRARERRRRSCRRPRRCRPARAPLRRISVPAATSPIAVRDNTAGPRGRDRIAAQQSDAETPLVLAEPAREIGDPCPRRARPAAPSSADNGAAARPSPPDPTD